MFCTCHTLISSFISYPFLSFTSKIRLYDRLFISLGRGHILITVQYYKLL
nr:MAG TPA: hypothetical protein [Bacteriophage sp.]